MRFIIVDFLKGRGVECVWRFWILKILFFLCYVNLGLLVYFIFFFRCFCSFFFKFYLDLSIVICGVSRIGRWSLVIMYIVRLELFGFIVYCLYVFEWYLRFVFFYVRWSWEFGCEGFFESFYYIRVCRDWEYCFFIYIFVFLFLCF